MIDNRRYLSNAAALRRVGINLLPGEELDAAVELESGLTEELESTRATLLLTNRRLIRYSSGKHYVDTISVALDDVHVVEVKRRERNRQWVFVGLVFIGGGALLGMLSLFWLATLISPLLMAVSLTLIGIVFLLTYIGGIRGEVIVTAGSTRFKSRMKPRAIDDMVVFLERFYELKLGVPTASRFRAAQNL
ncbi:MAG: hypothetical protein IIB17_02345 [Chloroflexi bacterium]|nr:hypothetical protein [Chloroflexota bacterium]